MPQDEMWTQRDGTQIAVGDMTETHVRNTLRMILRQQRKRAARAMYLIGDMTVGEMQDQLDTRARDHTGMVFNAAGGFWYHAS